MMYMSDARWYPFGAMVISPSGIMASVGNQYGMSLSSILLDQSQIISRRASFRSVVLPTE